MDVSPTKLRLFHSRHTLLTIACDAVCQSCKPLCQRIRALHSHCVSACYLWHGIVWVHSSGGCKGGSLGGGCSVGTVWRIRTWFIFLFGWTFRICCFNFFSVCAYHFELIGALLFKNYTNENPSLSQKMLAMTLPTEVCTLNLFFLIVPTVPICYPVTSIFLAWRMHRKGVILWWRQTETLGVWKDWCFSEEFYVASIVSDAGV